MRTGVVAAILVLSSSARADDAPTTKVTIGGYLETYYQLNLRTPSNGITNLRGFDNRDRTSTIENVALDAKGERGPVTAHVVLQVGATPTAYYAAEPVMPDTGPEVWKYIQTATLAYTTGKLVVDAGLFTSPIGPESIAIKDDWFWSRSNLFVGLPYYHTGVRVAYPLGRGWTGVLHVYDGWNSVVDNNHSPSVAASASFACKSTTAQVLYFGGIERDRAWRHLLDAYATFGVFTTTSVTVQGDAGVEPGDADTAAWAAIAGSVKVELTPKLYVAGRQDFFYERVPDGAPSLFWPTPWIQSQTATIAYRPADGLSVRFEYRHDQAKTDVYFGGHVDADMPNRRAQDTLTVGATAWF